MFVKRVKKILKLFIDKPLTPEKIESMLIRKILTYKIK